LARNSFVGVGDGRTAECAEDWPHVGGWEVGVFEGLFVDVRGYGGELEVVVVGEEDEGKYLIVRYGCG
jgi:hypothetical protein